MRLTYKPYPSADEMVFTTPEQLEEFIATEVKRVGGWCGITVGAILAVDFNQRVANKYKPILMKIHKDNECDCCMGYPLNELDRMAGVGECIECGGTGRKRVEREVAR